MDEGFKAVLREDFWSFAQKAHREINAGQELDDDPYLRLLANDAAPLSALDGGRLTVSLPPGHGKTFMFSIALPMWIIGHNPGAKGLIISHKADLAVMISSTALKIAESKWYRQVFGVRLQSASGGNFKTTKNGGLTAASIGSSITGFRADFIIIDDALGIDDHDNTEQIDFVNEKFDSEIRSRLNNPKKSSIVIVGHRLNENDLIGHVLKQGGWKSRVLPFIAPRRQTYDLGDETWVREKGDLLRPGAFDEATIALYRSSTKGPGFGPLYQQDFSGPDVLKIARRHIELYSPSRETSGGIILSVDPGQMGGSDNSFTVAQVWAVFDDKYYLVDQWREQARMRDARKACRALISTYCVSVVLIEATGFGPSLEDELSRNKKIDLHSIQPKDGKLQRWARHVRAIRKGCIAVPEGAAFVESYLDEMTGFPKADYDDQVDATTQFLDWISENSAPRPRPPRATFSTAKLNSTKR